MGQTDAIALHKLELELVDDIIILTGWIDNHGLNRLLVLKDIEVNPIIMLEFLDKYGAWDRTVLFRRDNLKRISITKLRETL